MILDSIQADKKLRRMALEIAERNFDHSSLILIGIKENGVGIADKIAGYLKESYQGEIEVLWVSLDKDKPGAITLSKEMDFNNQSIILIDDVANSGRTMLYALKPLLEYLPRQIETLVLVERTHKLFPIDVNYVGISVSSTTDENIKVRVKDNQIMGADFETV